ncbi:unnamed protein product [Chrysoparadoxa australica]
MHGLLLLCLAGVLASAHGLSSLGAKESLLSIFGVAQAPESSADPVLAEPGTLAPLRSGVRVYGTPTVGAITRDFMVGSEGKYPSYVAGYTDLVPPSPSRAPWELSRDVRVMESLFQLPTTSFLYERGWRQAFTSNGFPGIDKEFEDLVKFCPSSGATIDLSCGSGLMTRRLVKSGRFGRVIGADLSSSMLMESARRFGQEGLPKPELIRCDVRSMPIQSGSINLCHAGAALHCWVQLEDSLKEVYRILAPGGQFYATTFLTSALISGVPTNQSTGFHFFTLAELEAEMHAAGFDTVEVTQSGRACAIVKCTKS